MHALSGCDGENGGVLFVVCIWTDLCKPLSFSVDYVRACDHGLTSSILFVARVTDPDYGVPLRLTHSYHHHHHSQVLHFARFCGVVRP